VLALSCTALAIEIPLVYERYSDERSSVFRPHGNSQLEPTAEPPGPEWKLPSLNSKKPLYVLAEMGSDQVLFILDAQKADVDYYDRIYFDESVNKDLTDDPVVDGIKYDADEPGRWWSNFPAIDTTVMTNGAISPYSFRPGVHRYTTQAGSEGSSETLTFYRQLNCAYSGEFEADGKKYRVVLSDGNVNGRFNDLPPFPRTGQERQTGADYVYLTSGDQMSYYDGMAMANLWLFGGTLYEMTLEVASMKLLLLPSTQKTATFRLPDEVERMSLVAEGGSQAVLVYQGGKRINIPAGNYSVVSYQLVRKEECGDVWRLGAMASNESPGFTLPDGGEADLAIGEPFTPKVVISGERKGALPGEVLAEVPLGLVIQGSAGETVTRLERVSGSRSTVAMSSRSSSRPKEPEYKILNSAGEIVAAGQFEYG